MIAPHELKNKTFSRAVRGYNPVEVDEYFDFLIEKYTEAYKAASEFEQKLNQVEAKYDELSNEEASIRSAILKAQKLGEAIVNNANKEAKEIKADLSARCDALIAEAKSKVEAEKENIAVLRKSAVEFQHKLYSEYVKHVEMIKGMNLEDMTDPADMTEENRVFEEAKNASFQSSDVTIITDNEITEQNQI